MCAILQLVSALPTNKLKEIEKNTKKKLASFITSLALSTMKGDAEIVSLKDQTHSLVHKPYGK